MNEVFDMVISTIYREYCWALDRQCDSPQQREIISLMRYRAEEMGYDDYARGRLQVPGLFKRQAALHDAWLMGFAEAAIRDSVDQLLALRRARQLDADAANSQQGGDDGRY